MANNIQDTIGSCLVFPIPVAKNRGIVYACTMNMENHVNAVVISKLDYGDTLLAGHKLQCVQKMAARITIAYRTYNISSLGFTLVTHSLQDRV